MAGYGLRGSRPYVRAPAPSRAAGCFKRPDSTSGGRALVHTASAAMRGGHSCGPAQKRAVLRRAADRARPSRPGPPPPEGLTAKRSYRLT